MPTKKQLQSKAEVETFEFGVREIQDLGFSIPKNLISPSDAHIGYGLSFLFNEDDNILNITVSVRFGATASKEENEFLNTHVMTSFFIKDMLRYVKGDTCIFPGTAMETMFGLSLSHTRAIFAKNIAGTKFSSFIIPLADPVSLYKNIMKANEESI